VIVETGHNGPKQYDWAIYRRGKYVNFSLPHQDAGGERDYISRDGRKRVLINID
jgi:coproporphyrinogen III oxidase